MVGYAVSLKMYICFTKKVVIYIVAGLMCALLCACAVALAVAREQLAVNEIQQEISTGNLVRARSLAEARWSRDAKALLAEIDSYYKYSGFHVPEYTLWRNSLWEDKIFDGALDVSSDGEMVAWIDGCCVRMMKIGSSCGPEALAEFEGEVFCVRFSGPQIHVLHSTGLDVYDAGTALLVDHQEYNQGVHVKVGQSMLQADERPEIPVERGLTVEKQKGYDAFLFTSDQGYFDCGIDPSWLYGYNASRRPMQVLIKEDTVFYTCADGHIVVSDNGQYFTVWKRI